MLAKPRLWNRRSESANIISMARRATLAFAAFSAICLSGVLSAVAQNAGEHLTPGTIIVASEKLSDPNFAETVVLITRRDGEGGTMGVVLNRPMDSTLAKAFPQLHGGNDPLYEGGPVSPDAVQALLRSAQKPETAEQVIADVYSIVRKALLEKSITERLPNSKFRVYLGYAGWGPGQLENEVRLGAWSTLRGVKYVFDSDPATLWPRLNRDAQSQVAQNRYRAEHASHATMEACRCSEPLFWRY
jgi:putative transcriptional regulator